jgi:hypothetical protein
MIPNLDPQLVEEDLCASCGTHIGWGHPDFHLSLCDMCAEQDDDNLTEEEDDV